MDFRASLLLSSAMSENNTSNSHLTADGILVQANRRLAQQEYNEAGALYGEVSERWPERWEGHYGIAIAAQGLGDLTLSLRAAMAAVGADRQCIPAYTLIGELTFNGGMADVGIEWLEGAAGEKPNEAVIFEWLVRLYAAGGRQDELNQCLERYSTLRGLPVSEATLLFARDPSLTQDIRARIATAAGY